MELLSHLYLGSCDQCTKSTCSRCAKCAKCQIFGTFSTPNTKMKLYQMFQISKIMPHCYTVSNMRRYGQQWQNGILLFYCIFLSPLPQISLFPSTLSYFFSLCHSLSLPSPPYLRKLLKITPVLAANLTASFSTTRRRSRCPKLRFWLIWWVLGFDLG